VTCGGTTNDTTFTGRPIHREPRYGGEACPTVFMDQFCGQEACPVDCQLSDWTAWGTCSKTCGNGTSTSTREIVRNATHGGAACSLEVLKSSHCEDEVCDQDCLMGNWTNATSGCPVTCGFGMMKRTRIIEQHPIHTGKACGASEGVVECNTQECPVNCNIGDWGDYLHCSHSCGGGAQIRTRTIRNDAHYGGQECPGTLESLPCNDEPCAIDCQWSHFEEWSDCDKSCGLGHKTRTRTILNDGSEHGGIACPHTEEAITCNPFPCPTPTPTSTPTKVPTKVPTKEFVGPAPLHTVSAMGDGRLCPKFWPGVEQSQQCHHPLPWRCRQVLLGRLFLRRMFFRTSGGVWVCSSCGIWGPTTKPIEPRRQGPKQLDLQRLLGRSTQIVQCLLQQNVWYRHGVE
jgi:hypothetical protein